LADTFTEQIQVKTNSKFRTKWSVGVSRGCPNFFEYPLLSQELVKLRTSNLARIFTGLSEQKPIKNLGEKGALAYPGTAQIFGYPLLSQERVKLRTSNFVGTFIRSIGTKANENVGNSGRGRSQGVPKIFRAPIYMAHCAVIFAIAQLSCLPRHWMITSPVDCVSQSHVTLQSFARQFYEAAPGILYTP